MRCNCCGLDDWRDMGTRRGVRCGNCNSLERTRFIKLLLDKSNLPRPGTKVLHFAPESALFPLFDRKDIEYEPLDFSPQNFPFCSVRKFDICTEAASLPSDYYDLILHSHVMEHIPCNVTAALYHIHRSLRPGGIHLMCVPFFGQKSAEDFGEISAQTAVSQFGQSDHVRRFGVADVQRNLGMLFRIPTSYTMLDYASEAELDNVNIPKRERSGFTGSTVFVLTKDALLLDGSVAQIG